VVTSPYVQIFYRKKAYEFAWNIQAVLIFALFRSRKVLLHIIYEWSVSIHYFKKEYSSFLYIMQTCRLIMNLKPIRRVKTHEYFLIHK